MNNPTLIISLAIFTLVVVIAVLVYQRARVAKAKTDHEGSAMTKGQPEQSDARGAGRR